LDDLALSLTKCLSGLTHFVIAARPCDKAEIEAAERAALARIHGSRGGAHVSSRPTDSPVSRFEDDGDYVEWDLATG